MKEREAIPAFEPMKVEPAGVLNTLKTGITGIWFSPNGKQLAVSAHKITYLWHLEQTREWKPGVQIEGRGIFLGFLDGGNHLLFLTEERELLKVLPDGTILVWLILECRKV